MVAPVKRNIKRASQEDTIENDISKYLQDSPIYLDYNVGRVGLHPHQSKSFQQSIEKWPIRQLYADEVGLGKTIEMGSTISYLVKNHLVDSVLILSPNICKQLQQQMLNLFDLNLQIRNYFKKTFITRAKQ